MTFFNSFFHGPCKSTIYCLKAIVKEKQAQEENARLQEAISKLLDEAGIRTRQEVGRQIASHHKR